MAPPPAKPAGKHAAAKGKAGAPAAAAAPAAPAAAAPAPAPEAPPPEAKQSPEELNFYASDYKFYTILAIIFFFPLGLLGCLFSRKTARANKLSKWEDAYRNSAITAWVDTMAVLISLALVYYFLFFL